MSKKSWVDKAVETGNWSEAESNARAELRKEGAKICAARQPLRERPIRRLAGLEPDAPEPADTSDDAVQEYVEDVPDDDVDVLPSDEEEAAQVPVERKPVVTLARAYAAYRARGGN